MSTPRGMRRVPCFQRRTALELTPNHRATRHCAMPSSASAASNLVTAAARGRRCLSGTSPRSGAPEWTEIVILMYLILISISIRSHRAFDASINETAVL